MADTRDIEASRPEFEAKMRAAGYRDDRHDTGEYVGVTSYRWEGWIAALASRPAEVGDMPKPPRTAEEMVACIGNHYESMRGDMSDPADLTYQLTVHDLLSAMRDWFEDYAESAYSSEKSAEVDDELRKHGNAMSSWLYGLSYAALPFDSWAKKCAELSSKWDEVAAPSHTTTKEK